MNTLTVYDLAPKTVLPLHGHAGTILRVLNGRVWVTAEGDPRDLFAADGEALTLDANGLVLVEGLTTARIALDVHAPSATVAQAARDAWRAVGHASGASSASHVAALGAE